MYIESRSTDDSAAVFIVFRRVIGCHAHTRLPDKRKFLILNPKFLIFISTFAVLY